jgi:hypothetical protein
MKVTRNIFLAAVTLYPPDSGGQLPLNPNAEFQSVSVLLGDSLKDCRLLFSASRVEVIAASIPFNVWIVFLDPEAEGGFVSGRVCTLWAGKAIGEIVSCGSMKTMEFGN